MNIGYAHAGIAAIAIIAAAVCGGLHAIAGSEVQTIIIGALGSLSGHAVGFAHGAQVALRAGRDG